MRKRLVFGARILLVYMPAVIGYAWLIGFIIFCLDGRGMASYGNLFAGR